MKKDMSEILAALRDFVRQMSEGFAPMPDKIERQLDALLMHGSTARPAVPYLLELAHHHRNERTRRSCVETVQTIEDPEGTDSHESFFEALRIGAHDSDRLNRTLACRSFQIYSIYLDEASPASIDAVFELARHEDPVTRMYVCRLLWWFTNDACYEELKPRLLALVRESDDPVVIGYGLHALVSCNLALEQLGVLTHDYDLTKVREELEGTDALTHVNKVFAERRIEIDHNDTERRRRVFDELSELIDHANPDVRSFVALALIRYGFSGDEAMPVLQELLVDRDERVRRNAMVCIRDHCPRASGAFAAVLNALSSSDEADSLVASGTIKQLLSYHEGPEQLVAMFICLVESADPFCRHWGVHLLTQDTLVGREKALPALITLLGDEEERLRLSVLDALHIMDLDSSNPVIRMWLNHCAKNDSSAIVREATRYSIPPEETF